MTAPDRMHRLLMGDVGTGKTVVALFAMLLAIENDFQAAFMAPTELLAEQHAATLDRLLGSLEIRPELLLGRQSAAEKTAVKSRLASGREPPGIGTHALMQESVAFRRLGLVVIDEQHRFGVEQRASLIGKGDTTATGRGNEIDGSITIAGTTVTEGSFTVQVASITSDRSQHDGQFTGRIMQTSQFPTATFTITQPVDLGTIPADGEQVTASVTGDLTLHGVTNSVTFDVTAQTDGTTIGVLGEIPIVFADYGIDNPSTGFVTTEDNGLLEFILVFTPAG